MATSASGYVDPAFTRYLVQVPGTAVRVTAQGFEDMIDASVGLCSAVSRYREVLLRTTLQIVACNAIHTVRQRSARWILTTHDRSGSDLLPLTHSALAEMLGVKRNAINITIRELCPPQLDREQARSDSGAQPGRPQFRLLRMLQPGLRRASPPADRRAEP